MNIIANSKVGKSWLVNDLAISVTNGLPWLGIFPTVQAPVLIIDNELHRETIAHRLRAVASANGIEIDPDDRGISVWPLRGGLLSVHQIAESLRERERGEFGLVILDAFYRVLPPGSDENSNADMASVYNALDALAEATGAGSALVHHASKGSQSEKSVTDVGSGAGAISRAADTHLILRRHQEEGAYVLDLALRSWPPAAPLCLRWRFPRWELARDLDPTELWRAGKPAKKDEPSPFAGWDAERAARLCPPEPTQFKRFVTLLQEQTGLPKSKATDLADLAITRGLLSERRGYGTGGSKNARYVCVSAPPTPPVGRREASYGSG